MDVPFVVLNLFQDLARLVLLLPGKIRCALSSRQQGEIFIKQVGAIHERPLLQ